MKYLVSIIFFCVFISTHVSAQFQDIENQNTIHNPYTAKKGQSDFGLSLELDEWRGLDLEVNYRYALTDRLLLRTSISIPQVVINNSESGKNISLRYVRMSAGLEYHIPITKRWSIYFGGEVGADRTKFQGFPSSSTNFISALAGVDYQLNKKLSIFCEVKREFELRNTYFENPLDSKNLYSSSAFAIGVTWKFGQQNK